MSREVPAEVLPVEATPNGRGLNTPARPRFSGRRLALAIVIAALGDGLSLLLTLTPPLQWAVDIVTALLLFAVLGRQWILLPGLLMEAIPGISVVPFWVLVVAGVALWGTARPGMRPMWSKLKSLVPLGKAGGPGP